MSSEGHSKLSSINRFIAIDFVGSRGGRALGGVRGMQHPLLGLQTHLGTVLRSDAKVIDGADRAELCARCGSPPFNGDQAHQSIQQCGHCVR